MAVIKVQNVVLGGIADSDFLGAENSVAEIVGFDLHSEPGIMKVNQKLTKDSGSTVDDLCKAKISGSDGNTYFFGSTNGKVFRRTSAGVWSVQATVAPGAGTVGVLGAHEYNGYFYYATSHRLGRVAVGAAWSTRDDNWATFTNADTEFKPMRVVNIVLYIGDGNFVAQVDAAVFKADALDIQDPLRIKSLGRTPDGTELLIGTYVADNVNETQLIKWNTWSGSFSLADPIPEVGINAFIDMDLYVIVHAGVKGNLYLFNGVGLEPYKTIKGNWRGTSNKATVHPEAQINFSGLPLFGLSNVSGNPALEGIYSYARASRNYPFILVLEYVLSTGNMTGVEIGSIAGAGDIFLVAWKEGTAYGVDVLDLTAKYSGAYFKTRIATTNRAALLTYKEAAVAYRSLPANTTIVVSKSVNYAALETVESTNDTDRLIQKTDVDISDAVAVQIKVATTASGNTAPELEYFEVGVA